MKIYCDGSTKGNGGKNPIGGIGYVILNDNEEIIKVGAKNDITSTKTTPTNQNMELLAMIAALNSYSSLDIKGKVDVYTDSAYIYNCWADEWYVKWEDNGWLNSKKEPVANEDFWQLLIVYFKDRNIILHKVKGHDGNKFNELVDKLATGEKGVETI